jgi:hypothetical protein
MITIIDYDTCGFFLEDMSSLNDHLLITLLKINQPSENSYVRIRFSNKAAAMMHIAILTLRIV